MTLAELQEILEGSGVVVRHMGASARLARHLQATRWSIELGPEFGSKRWAYDMRWRGVGASLEEALQAAVDKLAATVVSR